MRWLLKLAQPAWSPDAVNFRAVNHWCQIKPRDCFGGGVNHSFHQRGFAMTKAGSFAARMLSKFRQAESQGEQPVGIAFNGNSRDTVKNSCCPGQISEGGYLLDSG
jgi:hypothetical protein